MEKHCEKIRENIQGYFENSLSKQSGKNVEAHLKECPDCAWYFREYEKMNEILLRWNIPEIPADFEENVINAAKKSEKKNNSYFFFTFFDPVYTRYAAFLILVFSLGIYYFSLPVTAGTARETGQEESRLSVVKTGEPVFAAQEDIEISLNDGSLLTMSKGAMFRMDTFRRKEKLCLLEGDLRAEIRKYPGQEFKIRTASGEIQVLGTVLLVSAKKQKTIVSVIEGSVSVKGKTERALLTKGNIAVIIPNSKFVTPVSAADALMDSDESVRIQAIKTLVEFRGKQEMHLVADMLEDSDAGVRAEAAKGLCFFGKEEVTKLLIKTLQDKDKYVRAESALSLGKLKAMNAREHLKRMREDKDVEVRISVALALQDLGEKTFTIPEIIKDLDSRDPNTRINALKLIGKIGNTYVSAKVAEKLNDPDNNVKWYAISALESINDPKTFPALLPLLKCRDDEIKKKAVQTLSNICFSEGVPGIAALLSQPVSREVKFNAIRALGYLLPFYFSPDKDEQTELLARHINSPDRLLKVAALTSYSRALGAIPVLKRKVYEVSVKDGNKIMKETSAEILKNFYKQDFRVVLPSIEISALGKLKEKAVVPLLLTASKDWNPLTRKAAMESFEHIKNKKYLPVIYEGMKDSDSRVAEAAEQAVKTITQ